MSITPISDAGLLRNLILIILPILGLWMLDHFRVERA